MAKKKKFDEAGAVEEKTVWNKAKTRKWQMTYKLVEVKPSAKRKKSAENAAKKAKIKKVIKKTSLKKKKTTKSKAKSPAKA